MELQEEAPTASLSENAPPKFRVDISSTGAVSVTAQATLSFPRFEDASGEVGLTHVYDNGTTDAQLMTESTGGGAGWIDVDLDGKWDLCLTQGGAAAPESSQVRPSDVLLRQRPDGTFVDIAGPAGCECREYGQGAASTDVNNDGFPDLFITNVGRNRLFLNNGDGTFTESDDQAINEATAWSTTAVFGDIDQDGDDDLYVCNYADYDPYDPPECLDEGGRPSVCHPRNVPDTGDHFYLNGGDGTFTECSQERGLTGEENRALCAVILDLNHDGNADIYVGNDTTANFLFINDGAGHFRESALGLGGAVSATGASQASMGIGVGDYDNNGFSDLCLTHFTGEYNTLYQNNGVGGLRDVTSLTGLRPLTLSKLAFGVIMHDFNGDMRQDLIFANGHIDPLHPDGDGYEMRPQLVSYDGRRWVDGSDEAGAPFQDPGVARAAACADFDSDGDTDVVLVRQNASAVLLKNISPPARTLRIRLIGRQSARTAFGARLILFPESPQSRTAELFSGESFSAAHETVIEFSVPESGEDMPLVIHWPMGLVQSVMIPAGTQRAVLVEDRVPVIDVR